MNSRVESAKAADARHHSRKELASPLVGALKSKPVLRVFLKSAKGADARHHSRKELAKPLGGVLRTATVLRVFLKRRSTNRFYMPVRRSSLDIHLVSFSGSASALR